jgi:quinol monooxygenase YgiN
MTPARNTKIHASTTSNQTLIIESVAMLNQKNAFIDHIWELEGKGSRADLEKFCADNASKHVHGLNEEGTIRFEWFIANDNKTVTFIERLKDEAAAKERIKNHMDSHLAAEFPEAFDIKKLIVLGEIGPEIAETYAAFGAEIRTKVGGFS